MNPPPAWHQRSLSLSHRHKDTKTHTHTCTRDNIPTFSNRTNEKRHSWHITRVFVPIKPGVTQTFQPFLILQLPWWPSTASFSPSNTPTHSASTSLPPFLPLTRRHFTLTSSPCLGKMHDDTFISSWLNWGGLGTMEEGGQVSMVTVIWQFKPAIITSASKLASLSFYLAAWGNWL